MLKAEPGREHPERMVPTAIRVWGWEGQGWGQGRGKVWQSLESRRQDVRQAVGRGGANERSHEDCTLDVSLKLFIFFNILFIYA